VVLGTKDPSTFQEAMEREDSRLWLKAMESEIESMYDSQVWNLICLSQEKMSFSINELL